MFLSQYQLMTLYLFTDVDVPCCNRLHRYKAGPRTLLFPREVISFLSDILSSLSHRFRHLIIFVTSFPTSYHLCHIVSDILSSLSHRFRHLIIFVTSFPTFYHLCHIVSDILSSLSHRFRHLIIFVTSFPTSYHLCHIVSDILSSLSHRFRALAVRACSVEHHVIL